MMNDNLQYFSNEYIQQLEQVDEIFLWLLLHLNVFHAEVDLQKIKKCPIKFSYEKNYI